MAGQPGAVVKSGPVFPLTACLTIVISTRAEGTRDGMCRAEGGGGQ